MYVICERASVNSRRNRSASKRLIAHYVRVCAPSHVELTKLAKNIIFALCDYVCVAHFQICCYFSLIFKSCFFFVYKIFTHFAFASVDEFANHSVQSIALHYRLGITLLQFSRIYQRITVCSLDSPTYKQTNIHVQSARRESFCLGVVSNRSLISKDFSLELDIWLMS